MASNDSTAVVYFALLHEHRAMEKQSSTTAGLHQLADLAIAAMNQHNFPGALEVLLGLKRCFDALRPIVDESAEREHRAATEYMALRKQNLELQLMIAKLTGEDLAAIAIQRWISEMDRFFLAAIDDLDPKSQ
jgi:hypothetical protein